MLTRRNIEPEVTFVNLIDVTLVLLIIFMITAPAIQNNVDVRLPAGRSSNANIAEGIVVSVTKEGEVYVDREKIEANTFDERFKEIWEDRAGEPVFIRGDTEAPYGDIMNVLATIKDIGGENVGLVVEERSTR